MNDTFDLTDVVYLQLVLRKPAGMKVVRGGGSQKIGDTALLVTHYLPAAPDSNHADICLVLQKPTVLWALNMRQVGSDVAAWVEARTLDVWQNACMLPDHPECNLVVRDLLAHGAYPNSHHWLPMPVNTPHGQQLLHLLREGLVVCDEDFEGDPRWALSALGLASLVHCVHCQLGAPLFNGLVGSDPLELQDPPYLQVIQYFCANGWEATETRRRLAPHRPGGPKLF